MALTLNGTTGISGIAGSAGTPALQGNNDANTGYFFATDTLGLSTAGTERLKVTSAGLISIGDNTNLDSQLTITQSVGDCIRLRTSASNNTYKYGIIKLEPYNNNALGVQIVGAKSDSGYTEVDLGGGIDGGYAATQLDFWTAANTTTATGSRRLRITSTGQILVGTTSDGGTYDGVTPDFVSEKSSTYQAHTLVVNANHAGQSSILQFVKSRGTSNGANTIVQDGDRLGSIYGIGADGTNRDTGAAAIDFRVDGTPGTNDMPGRIEFRTTNDGAAVPSEKVVIKADGKVGIGTASPSNLVHIEKSHADPLVVIKNTSGQANEGACLKLWASGRGSGLDDEDIFVINDTNNARNFGVSNAGTINTTGNIKMASGKGIDFSATANGTGSAQNELFDDYEEGTWTPAYDTSGSTGAISNVTYATQVGRYVKIGRVVYLEGVLKTSAITVDTSGTYDIGGMPFTTATGTAIGAVFTYLQNSWNNAPRSFDAVAGTTRMRGRQGIDVGDGSYTTGNTNDFQTSAGDKNRIYFSGHYKV